MSSRTALMAYNKQIRQLPEQLQAQECGLIELGRMHARNFDEGHSPSGGAVQRVLGELRRLANRDERLAAKAAEEAAAAELAEQAQQAPSQVSELDQLRARRAARTAN